MFLEKSTNNPSQGRGWIEVIVGSMFSGKTEELIRRLTRARIAKQSVEIFKPEIDKRYDDVNVVSHNENSIRSIPIIVAGLDMDFQGKPFGPIPAIMATAEYVTKVHAICMRCGDLAHYSHRTTDSEKLVLLGEMDNYEPLCRKCYTDLKIGYNR